jgi:hypothetical protein
MWQFIPKANVPCYCFSKVSFSNSFVVMYIVIFLCDPGQFSGWEDLVSLFI